MIPAPIQRNINNIVLFNDPELYNFYCIKSGAVIYNYTTSKISATV